MIAIVKGSRAKGSLSSAAIGQVPHDRPVGNAKLVGLSDQFATNGPAGQAIFPALGVKGGGDLRSRTERWRIRIQQGREITLAGWGAQFDGGNGISHCRTMCGADRLGGDGTPTARPIRGERIELLADQIGTGRAQGISLGGEVTRFGEIGTLRTPVEMSGTRQANRGHGDIIIGAAID